MIKFDVLNRFARNIQFTAEIDCQENQTRAIKLKLAVLWAIKNKVDLRGADLRGADLSDADLSDTNLSDANLSDTNLSDANLRRANLRGIDLRRANLRGTDLSWTDLTNANLRGTDLSWTDLRGADLSWTDLRWADLRWAKNLNYQICPEQGEFTAWKKLSENKIALIKIPAKAGRITAIGSRKCRAEYVKVLKIFDNDGKSVTGIFESPTSNKKETYEVGKITRADKFNNDPREECAGGIHFFMTKQEAIDWE